MTRYILVAGTHGAERPDDFDSPDHFFADVLKFRANVLPVSIENRFVWSTALDGLAGKNYTWMAAGSNLYSYAVPPLCPEKRIPSNDLLVIAFSHGVQVALYAFALGLKGRFISVNPPIRDDMIDVAKQARPNIVKWLNLYGDWRDVWAVLGAVRDGHLGIRRKYPEGLNIQQELVPGAHGAAVRERKYAANWPRWIQQVTV